ncbi:MAG: 4-alpha-glucanotransferase, partial [Anaerolineaceae bacterium]|nr:4-alpha-glucanotransferase [Anaerolineaceae bacterium]
RSAGIILHPSSLPGPDGIGDLGPEAFRWIDFLADTGCHLWQVLPLGPTGYGDSPYQCFSAFAGNPYLISSALLLADDLLTRSDLADRPKFQDGSVDFGPTIQWKLKLLDRAYDNFKKSDFSRLRDEFLQFQRDNQNWLTDFVLFMAIKENLGGGSWSDWPEDLRSRKTAALAKFNGEHGVDLERHAFRQFLFSRQWQAVREYAHEKQIQIIGDVPIFIAYDSADAWSHPELFYLDKTGRPTVVAGVPPDYFSPTGQLWGNPLYRWDVHKEQNYAWWIDRVKAGLKLFDILRLDHFRGFAGYWEVPADMPTAEKGRWVPGPGADVFNAIKNALGDLPLIAEDLGEITPDVVELREQFQLPGMKILQFAFSTDADDPFLPHNYPTNCVVYTGTHDNDTTRGWYDTTAEVERDFIRRYLARSGNDVSWDAIRAVWSSVAVFSLAPMQDLLSLGGDARMNFPGHASGNWSWRMQTQALDPYLASRVKEMNLLYSRCEQPEKPAKKTDMV